MCVLYIGKLQRKDMLMIQVTWTVPIYEEFKRLTYMTDFQREVMDLHVRRESDVAIALKLNTSVSAVQRAIRECKDMYDLVQPHSQILPVRRKTVKES